MLGYKGRVCGRARNEVIQENIDPRPIAAPSKVVVVMDMQMMLYDKENDKSPGGGPGSSKKA